MRRVGSLALAVLPLLAGCDRADITKYPQTIYYPASDYAVTLLWLQDYITILGVVVGILVLGGLGYVLYRFRYQPGMPEPKPVHGHAALEAVWTFIPALILAAVAVPTVRAIFETQRPVPSNAIQVGVVGWQWWWEFQYVVGQDTIRTANEIHVPVGTPVALRMRAGDVLHSFWVPQMGGKRDLIPNKTNTILFTPQVAGVYHGQCAEFCGQSHALMRMRLIAHEPAEFREWLRNEASPRVAPTDSSVALGEKLFQTRGCVGCHVVKGMTNAAGQEVALGRLGPNLTHFGRRRTVAAGILENNAENLAVWLRNPPAVKPGSKMPNLNLQENEIGYLVAYLQSLQ